MTNQKINKICSYIILGLSLFAMCLVVGASIFTFLGRFNPAPDGDEGALAHLFQLAIVLLFPTGLAFLATADWGKPVKVLKLLALPAAALIVAFSLLYYMEHV